MKGRKWRQRRGSLLPSDAGTGDSPRPRWGHIMRLLPVIALLALVATQAQAAPPVYDWSGAYIGAFAGAASGHSTNTTVVGCPDGGYLCAPNIQEDNGLWVEEVGSGSGSGSAFSGGGFAGYNWQNGAIVYGIEADIGAMPLSVTSGGSAETVNEGLCNGGQLCGQGGTPSVFSMTTTASTDWLATVRGRAGFLLQPGLLLYGTAGLAASELTVSNAYADDFNNGTGTGGRESSSTTAFRAGLAIGVGGEWAFAPRWKLRAEYLHTAFANLATTGGVDYLPQWSNVNPITSTANLRVDILRIGVAYGF
jgi:outer membrane immunogenic protein